ncbi:MAG: HD domain-containing protein [Oscillospiraceae bacterium]|nr:HD domain-containing protein [Oscillospiraceae bacterium]
MDDKLISDAIAYMQDLFRGNADGHDAAHTLRVWRTALLLARSEPGCDVQLVALAALLHDVDDHKLFRTEDQANARAFLESRGVPPERIARICEAIASVSFSRNRGRRPATLEGQIVQDADRLDAIGAIGIARTFAYGGRHGRDLESSIAHFHEKLLLLRDEMNTPAARALAEERHAFMTQFLAQYEKESAADRPPLCR